MRRASELAVTPNVRVDILRLDGTQLRQAAEITQLRESVADIEANLPAVLNAISSMSGAARLVKRELDAYHSEFDALLAEFDALRSQFGAHQAAFDTFRAGFDALRGRFGAHQAEFDAFRAELDELTRQLSSNVQQLETDIEDVKSQAAEDDLRVLGEVRPHVETLSWLMRRVETVRFEMLNELRYGREPTRRAAFEQRIVNPEVLERSPLRLNIGAGHIPSDDYVNIDIRQLPGIDVVASVEDVPFEPGTVDEIFSSHTLEHFPQEMLRRKLLPYWQSLLKPGGVITTVAPDMEAMAADYQQGEMPFEDFREVLYGSQEYEGDAHFTGFTPDSFCALLLDSGFVEPVIVASDRRNGKCKEFEITARKAE